MRASVFLSLFALLPLSVVAQEQPAAPALSPESLFPEGLSDEEYQRIYEQRLLPVMEEMLESIQQITKQQELTPLVNVAGTDLYQSTLYDRDVSEHWGDVVEPLLMVYAEEQSLEPAQIDAPETINALMAEAYQQIDVQIAYYEKAMEKDELTVDQLNELASSLDIVLATRASLQQVGVTIAGNANLFDAELGVYRENQGKLIASLNHLADTHGGNVVKTAHGSLSPDSLLTFLENQEKAGNITFISSDYRAKLFGYVDSLSPDTSK